VKYKSEWEKLYPVRNVKNDPHSFLCISCNKQISCSHQGLKDIKDHCSREAHKVQVWQTNKTQNIFQFFSSPNSNRDAIKAEVILIQHNLPISTSAHLGPLFKIILTTAIINEAMGPHCHEYIVQHCKEHPFSLGIDG
jgi:hypothetical protein